MRSVTPSCTSAAVKLWAVDILCECECGSCMHTAKGNGAALQAHSEACSAIGYAQLAEKLLEMNKSSDDANVQHICHALADAFFPR